ncbi:MAG: hypothetical protein Q8S13_02135, partial [Dehalococcoidia bacterium]|nr:hypothetical protein [Dehalococcoidia bacterium]
MSDRVSRYTALLLLDWLNQRFGARLEFSDATEGAFVASDGEHRVGLYAAPLWEREAATEWEERLRSLEERLSTEDEQGSFLLWVPPRADVPTNEPAASEFVARVQSAAASLRPGERTEVAFPVTVKMAKVRDEGGYASVTGGLSRWWTRITESVSGTYHVDSSSVHRITQDGPAREELWETIGRLAQGIETGQVGEFEVEQAWTLQRLPAPEAGPGFALGGAPPSVDPTDGILVRRTVRKRLQAANEALGAL